MPSTGLEPVAFYGVMKEWDKPLIIAMRLKVINGKITEIEHVLARNIRPDWMQNLVTARPGLLADVNDNERTPRQTMIDAADSYFEAIEHGKGSIAPFAEDCERHENGGQTTHNKTPVPWPVDLGSPKAYQDMAVIGTLTCSAQVDSQVLSFITRLWPRRLTVVDEQKGLVFSFPMFQHRGGVRSIKMGPWSRRDPHGRRDVESASRRDFQDSRRQDSRDRGDGGELAVRDEEPLGVIATRYNSRNAEAFLYNSFFNRLCIRSIWA